MSDKLIVMVAPSIPPYMAAKVPGLDLSPAGVAREVVRAYNMGANIVHLHVWDEHGQPTGDLACFHETLHLIREECDIVIEGSTGGINTLSAAERCISLQAQIELASLNPGSVNYDKGVYINSPDDIHYWATEMQARQIKPDVAVFEAGMIENTLGLVRAGLVQAPFLFSFVLGQTGAMPATAKNVLFLSELVPAQSHWIAVAHGGQGLNFSLLSLAMGGHVRAGFEDNPFLLNGEPAASNAQLVERIVSIARQVGREPATPAEVRLMLGL